MKIKNILILAILAASFCACSDLINPSVQNAQTEEQMFKDPSSAMGILGYAYGNLPFETKSTTDIATDDAVTNDLSSSYVRMAQGTWAANNDPMSQWQARKITIQYLNLFLKNVNNVSWSKDPNRQAMFIDKLRGEALALRALNMYYLLRNHAGWTSSGELLGVPIILEPEGVESDFNQPRATFQACVDQIYADIDEAMELPFSHRIEVRGLTPESTYDVRCHVAESSFGMMRGGEAEMKAELAFCVLAMENRKEEMIVDTKREEFEPERMEEMPSMVGYTVKREEKLWDIAKRYCSAPEDIIRVTERNGEVREGDILLIVKPAE